MEIRAATHEDILRYNLRAEDERNLNIAGYGGVDGLFKSKEMSDYCWVVEDKGKLLSIAGVAKNEKGATIWIMFDANLESLPLSFFKESKKYVRFMLNEYGYIENFAEVNKTFVMKWAESMGFTIDKPIVTEYGTLCRVHIGGDIHV